MSDFLELVIAERRADAQEARSRPSRQELLATARRRARVSTRSGEKRPIVVEKGATAWDPLTWMLHFKRAESRMAVIAEVKRRSRARGRWASARSSKRTSRPRSAGGSPPARRSLE